MRSIREYYYYYNAMSKTELKQQVLNMWVQIMWFQHTIWFQKQNKLVSQTYSSLSTFYLLKHCKCDHIHNLFDFVLILYTLF